jgi:hypothetical protein
VLPVSFVFFGPSCKRIIVICGSMAHSDEDAPSFTFHFAMFPSVIVGDMAGIEKLCAACLIDDV